MAAEPETTTVQDIAGNKRTVTRGVAWWHDTGNYAGTLYCIHSVPLDEPCETCGVRMQPPVV